MRKQYLAVVIAAMMVGACGGGSDSGTTGATGATGSSATPSGTTGSGAGQLSGASYLNTVAANEAAASQLSKTAAQSSANPAVRTLAQQVQIYFVSLNQQVTQVATNNNVTLNQTVQIANQTNVLNGLSGSQLDIAYLRQLVTNLESILTTSLAQARVATSTQTTAQTNTQTSTGTSGTTGASGTSSAGTTDTGATGTTTGMNTGSGTASGTTSGTTTGGTSGTATGTTGTGSTTGTTTGTMTGTSAGTSTATATTPSTGTTTTATASTTDTATLRIQAFSVSQLLSLETSLTAAQDLLGLVDPNAYLTDTYQDGLLEIQLAQTVAQQSSNSQVKTFAQQMIAEHTAANQQIATLLQSRNVTVPQSLTALQQEYLAQLSGFSGADFDRVYMDRNVTLHAADVQKTTDQSQRGVDAAVKAQASQLLPTLQNHLQLAQQIDASLTPTTTYTAWQSLATEAQLGNLCVQSSNPTVQSFGQQILQQNTTLTQQTLQTAQSQGLRLPLVFPPALGARVQGLTPGAANGRDALLLQLISQNAAMVQSQQIQTATQQTQSGTMQASATVQSLLQTIMQSVEANGQRAAQLVTVTGTTSQQTATGSTSTGIVGTSGSTAGTAAGTAASTTVTM